MMDLLGASGTVVACVLTRNRCGLCGFGLTSTHMLELQRYIDSLFAFVRGSCRHVLASCVCRLTENFHKNSVLTKRSWPLST